MLMRRKHREARVFLDSVIVKKQIQAAIDTIKQKMENRVIQTTVSNIFGLLHHYPNCGIGRVLVPIMPEIMHDM